MQYQIMQITCPFMLHDDKIAHVAIEKKLKWFQKNNLFSITDMNLEIFLMNQAL